MSITAPTLTTTISSAGYVNEIDDNFSGIQTYMDDSAAYINSTLSNTQAYPFTLYHTGGLTAGAMNAGILVPFAGDIVLAYARLNVCLTDTDANLIIELRDGATDVFGTNGLSWDGGDGNTIKLAVPGTPLTTVTAGTYLQIYTIFDTYDWTAAEGLCFTLLVRRS